MNATIRSKMMVWSALISLPALVGLGCGDEFGGKRYAVSGKVTYKGEPVKKGNISFIPTTPDGRGAAGQIVDGQYTLTTFSPSDGALPGTYKVTIDDRQMDAAKAQADADAAAKKRGVNYGGNIPQELIGRAGAAAKGALPGKYQIPETSGLQQEVKAQSNTIDFALTD